MVAFLSKPAPIDPFSDEFYSWLEDTMPDGVRVRRILFKNYVFFDVVNYDPFFEIKVTYCRKTEHVTIECSHRDIDTSPHHSVVHLRQLLFELLTT